MVTAAHMLMTDWGVWPAPSDLVALYDAAPKRAFVVTDLDCALCGQMWTEWRPDVRTEAGRAFYTRERELIRAIDTVCAAGFDLTYHRTHCKHRGDAAEPDNQAGSTSKGRAGERAS